MTVTQSEFQAYINILQHNGIDGDDLLRLLEEIVTGEWEASISFCEPDYDPMSDFNYPGSKYHY